MSEIKNACHTCHIEVEPINHFTAKDGRILCEEHKKGVDPCSQRLKEFINAEKYYGKIEYLYGSSKIGEVMYFKDKKSFEKEIHDSVEIGRPINPVKYNSNYRELEK